MAEQMCMMNDALSRLGQGCQIGHKCSGGMRALSLGLGPISIMADYMCKINEALSRPGQGCHIGYECNGGIRTMSKFHPSHDPYRIRTQWWDEGNEQAPFQPYRIWATMALVVTT